MQYYIVRIFKGIRKLRNALLTILHHIITKFAFYSNNVRIGAFRTQGVPYIMIAMGGKCVIGSNLALNNVLRSNPIGRAQKCVIAVDRNGILTIGNHVGMSFTAINCQQEINIGDNVIIGGGTCIYDSDYHPLKAEERIINNNTNVRRAPVTIEDNVFIGTNCTVLKGVRIGRNSIIGACSVVSKNIPPNEIWAGNPARFIKSVI
jgi:acetyltransferase-like isoleucine patch superfamily enzyme